ncbi:MAG: ribonuclease P protein component [Planctomycetota bacterium]|nr:MAG: ribonuclease P protein component [Planctomycetota bacterium]
MADFRFPKKYRLRKAHEFQRVFEGRQRAGDSELLVFALRNGLPYSRLGLSVSRKHGSAVRRNRLKRLIREAFRLSRHELPTGLDLIVIPRIGREHSLESIRRSLIRLTHRLDRRLPPCPQGRHDD